MHSNPLGNERSARPPWLIFGSLVFAVALLGGSSRPDAIQLVPLRAVAALLLFLGLIWVTREQLSRNAPVVGWLSMLAALTALQLIPLPPSFWQVLPGRDGVTALERAWELEGAWRPISLVPDRTLNALLSLLIPFAAVISALATKARPATLLTCVIAIAFLDASIGILQSLGASQLQFYAITTPGAPVGLFANENHSGVFSAVALLLIALVGTSDESPWQEKSARVVLSGVYLTILLAALLTGSRAGFLMTLVAVPVSIWAVWLHRANKQPEHRARSKTGFIAFAGRRKIVFAFLLGGSLVLSLLYGNRIPALVDLLGEAGFESQRWLLAPVLLEMMFVFWGPGAGIGAFEEVYHIFEPDGLMQPRYLNQAHNDWAQLVIEGGLPALILASSALAYLLHAMVALARRGGVTWGCLSLWAATFLIVAIASFVDYPLRTPLGQFAGMLCILAFLSWRTLGNRSAQDRERTMTSQRPALLRRPIRDRSEVRKAKASCSWVLCVGVLGLGLSGCAGTRDVGLADSISVAQVGKMPEPQVVQIPGIKPLDELEIFVVGIAELGGTYVADEAAQVLFPHIGLVNLSGLSANQAARKLADRLDGEFLKNPQVRVLRKQQAAQSVSVGGQVNRPGTYSVRSTYSLLRAVNDAGGLGESADTDDVLVLRSVAGDDYVGVYNLRAIARGNYADPKLYPGDIVMVGDNPTRRTILEAVRLVPFVSSFVVLINRL